MKKAPKSQIPLWERVQAIRTAREMHGAKIGHSLMDELAKVEVVDVALMKPIERAEYTLRLERRL